MRRFSSVIASALVAVGSVGVYASDFDVVIHEIHYHPLGDALEAEFIELHNRGPSAVNLGGWQLVEGVHLELPDGLVIEPKAFLVVSPDADLARSRLPGVDVVGDYTGRLDNGGEIVTLVNAAGEVASRVHYEDHHPWPARPDGLGPSLELLEPHAQPDDPSSWAGSLVVGGTPGRPNSWTGVVEPEERVVLGGEALWHYFKGTQEPPANWNAPEFNDGSWPQGPGNFGYASSGSFGTDLSDMAGDYTTVYLRGTFPLTASEIADVDTGVLGLYLTVRYDDGCIVYLNGDEIERRNAGTPGTLLPHDAVADGSMNSQLSSGLQRFTGSMKAGENVLAIQGFNHSNASSDFLVDAEVRLARQPLGTDEMPPATTINEVKPSEPGSAGFIELHHRGPSPADLSGHAIIDSAGNRGTLPAGASIAGGSRLVLSEAELGFPIALDGRTYVLVEEDPQLGDRFVDAIETRSPAEGSTAPALGRVPDGGEKTFILDDPSPGEPNAVTLPLDVIVNEIHFHPPFVPPDATCDRNCSDAEQWIEIHNRGGDAIDVSGWALAGAVELDLPDGTVLESGGFLVVAASRVEFLVRNPSVDPAKVLGDWQRHLARDSDTIRLLDARTNDVDRVTYGDGKPVNDVDPADGQSDETFVGTTWRTSADRTGRTLELVHPLLDNALGGAWASGPVGGTPGAQNASWDPNPPPAVDRVRHEPAVPSAGIPVTVRCVVSATTPIVGVNVDWHREGGTSGVGVLRDDGVDPDLIAGDGEYAGEIPGQPEGAVVAFTVGAETQGSQATTVPASPPIAPYAGFVGPFFLYQVISAPPLPNPSESYYVILTESDRGELESRSASSDVLLPCTFIHIGKSGSETVRHLAGIRYRGSSLRNDARKSYRIDFPSEQRFRGIMHLNLNAIHVDRELLVTDLFRRAGMPYPREWSVNLTFQGELDTLYVQKEHLDVDFLYRYFGSASASGDLYRALDPSGDPREGDLTYFGEDPVDYAPYYQKRTNKEEADYSDVIELCKLFDPAETPDEVFADSLEQLVDVDQWARYFAIQSLVSNSDGSIQNQTGEDYFLYKVPETSNRPDAGKWVLIPWDVDESFSSSSEPLFPSQIPSIRRFLRHPRFAPLYYKHFAELRSGVFSRKETRQRFVLIDFLYGFSTLDSIDTYITNRIGFLDTHVPVQLSSGAGSVSASGTPLIDVGDVWRFWRGSVAPPGAALAWTAQAYDDGGWEQGPTGIGYGDGDDATLINDMRDNYLTLFARRTFQVSDPSSAGSLLLTIDYDDAFVAYLNGTEVARRNVAGVPGEPLTLDAHGEVSHEAGTPESIDLSSFAGLLVAGDNVLAFQVLNDDLGSSDLTLIPILREGASSGTGIGCGTVLYTSGDAIGLSGESNSYRTRAVLVNGEEADYDPLSARWSGVAAISPGENTVVVDALDGPPGSGSVFESISITVVRLERPLVQASGTLSGQTEWTEAGGPYLMTSNVQVPAGSKLTIRPGTLVIGEAGASIIVRGHIEAVGTASAPVRFRAYSCDNRWGGIAMDGTGTDPASVTHVLRYCDFEFGDSPSGYQGCVAPVGAKLLAEHCAFQSLTANAIDGTNARVEVRDCLFDRIHEGVHCTSSTVVILDSTFRGMVGDKDGIDFDLNGSERSRIERCLIENGSDDGIDLQETTVDIRDNVFRNIADKALSLEGDGPLGPPTITGNLIYDSGTAVALKSGIHIGEGHHNTIVGNQEGVSLWAKAGAPDGGHGTFHSMIVWNNIIDVKIDALSSATFTHSNISAGVYPGEGNISRDPRFVDVLAGNFALRPSSPCIETGKDGSDMGAVPFTIVPVEFVRSDSDSDGTTTVGDAIRTLEYLFLGGPAGRCLDAHDSNDDGGVDLADPVFTLIYLFVGGEAPPAPFPDSGPDATEDALPCG